MLNVWPSVFDTEIFLVFIESRVARQETERQWGVAHNNKEILHDILHIVCFLCTDTNILPGRTQAQIYLEIYSFHISAEL